MKDLLPDNMAAKFQALADYAKIEKIRGHTRRQKDPAEAKPGPVQKSHCQHGHPYTCLKGGRQYCLVCQRERRRR